jgi:tyrosine-protein phosphatase
VYDPHIDLYLEPTAEQCRQYDVILNVASEVRNPLIEQFESNPEEPDIRIDGGGGIQFAPRRDWILNKDGKGIPNESSPTTPKATPVNGAFPVKNGSAPNNEPEYIHIMWEHNSDIVPDLLRLVKLIDEKALQGKRVLVHCQCGVSRSASLVVAYGLYKNPALSVQEAYDAVKKRSKWIGPNMNLIMQLQEFRTSLMRGGLLSANRGLSPLTPGSAISEWRGPFAMSPTEREGPLSAGVSKHQASESMPAFSPGPSSAPSSMPWPTKESGQRARAISAVKPGTAYVSPAGRIVPVVPLLNVVEPESAEPKPAKKKPLTLNLKREEREPTTPTEAMKSPREEEFHLTPLQPSPDFDAADSFGVMSPTTSEFTTNPFDRSALLAQLGMGPVGRQEESPRRSISLHSKPKPPPSEDTAPQTTSTEPRRIPRLRGKISSPSIREQQQLQSLQAKISASLPHRTAHPSSLDADDALMSPRATEFTQNPFALSLSIPPEQQQEAAEEAPQSPVADPRSPAQAGISPITRNILDVL